MIAALTATCVLVWNPQQDATGFRIWRGIELVAVTTEPRAVIQLPADQLSTLTVTATNGISESEHSDPLTVLPVTPQVSGTLVEWTSRKPFFVKFQPCQFFRFSYPLHP